MKPKDRIALVIAVGLVTWGVLGIGGVIFLGKSLGEQGSEALIAIGGALAAMLATYFASSKNGNNGDKKNHDKTSDD